MTTRVVKTNISNISYKSAVEQVILWSQAGRSRYVCVANVHMVMQAFDLVEFCQIVNQADMVTPDGMPLVWMMRLKGYKDQQRVYGPTLMLHLLEAAAKEKISVGFYGGSPKVLDALLVRMKERFSDLNVAYSFSPPFRDLDEFEKASVVQDIRRSGVQILFVGLGCPKQEIWMSEHRGKINAVMLGVGAAFDFHAGVKPQAPLRLQNLGLEWLFRLITEPGRLWKRYLYHNPRFLWLATLDLLGLIK